MGLETGENKLHLGAQVDAGTEGFGDVTRDYVADFGVEFGGQMFFFFGKLCLHALTKFAALVLDGLVDLIHGLGGDDPDLFEGFLVGIELFFDDGGGETGDLVGQFFGGSLEIGAEGNGGLGDFGLVGGFEARFELGGGRLGDFERFGSGGGLDLELTETMEPEGLDHDYGSEYEYEAEVDEF